MDNMVIVLVVVAVVAVVFVGLIGIDPLSGKEGDQYFRRSDRDDNRS